jgi:hypothetical protein
MIRLYRSDNAKQYRDFPDYTFSRYNYAVFDFTSSTVTIESVVYVLPPEIVSDAIKVTVVSTTSTTTATTSDDAFTVTDEPGNDITYLGWAASGCTGTSDAMFCIKKIFKVNAQTFQIWAEGNQDFDKSWDKRASYNYPFTITDNSTS